MTQSKTWQVEFKERFTDSDNWEGYELFDFILKVEKEAEDKGFKEGLKAGTEHLKLMEREAHDQGRGEALKIVEEVGKTHKCGRCCSGLKSLSHTLACVLITRIIESLK